MKRNLMVIGILMLAAFILSSCDNAAVPSTPSTAIKEVDSLSDISDEIKNAIAAKEGFTLESTDVVYSVKNWQNLDTTGNLTIKNVIFKQGLSIHTYNTEDVTVTIENCIIYACDQSIMIEEKDTLNPWKLGNSGNGLCLAIDTASSETAGESVSLNLSNNKLIGAYDEDGERKDSYVNWEYYETKTNLKSRGNGISLGNQAGNTEHLKSAVISGNTFEGLKGHAIQLYVITTPATVEIKDNVFKSWGINKTSLVEDKDYAIRGDITAESPEATIVLSGNTYASSYATKSGTSRDLANLKVAIDNWNQNGSSYDQSKAQ